MSSPLSEDLPHYTWSDYQCWEGRWEIIHGIPYAMSPAPAIIHQLISQNIAQQLGNLLAGQNNCHALLPVDWKIMDDCIVQPDNLVSCASIDERFLSSAPLIVFEVLSPSTAHKDKTTKFKLYEQAGVKYYCIVDPEINKVEIFVLINTAYCNVFSSAAGIFSFELPDLRIDFDFDKIWP